MDRNFEMARDFFVAGVKHYEAGRYLAAEQQFAAALGLVPGRPSVLLNLGATRLKLGRAEEALALLEEVLRQEPDNAEALAHLGAAQAHLGRLDAALQSFDRSLGLNAAQPVAWMHRGTALRDMGRAEEAVRSFENALAHGGDERLNAYYLAALKRLDMPAAPPREYVQALFDGYAKDFDRHVTEDLHYDAPRVLVERLVAGGRRFEHALDLGCGTGLCGRLLKPHVRAVDGIDLSANMLDAAEALHVYELLEQADIADYLRATERRYDLAIAADVMIYVGALDPVFEGAARVLRKDAPFALTLEKGDADMELRPSLRYAHSERHVREVASKHGFWVDHIETRTLREEQRMPIPGLFVWLRRA